MVDRYKEIVNKTKEESPEGLIILVDSVEQFLFSIQMMCVLRYGKYMILVLGPWNLLTSSLESLWLWKTGE